MTLPPPPPPCSLMDETPRQGNNSNKTPPPLFLVENHNAEGKDLQPNPTVPSSFYQSILEFTLENEEQVKQVLQATKTSELNDYADHDDEEHAELLLQKEPVGPKYYPDYSSLVAFLAAAAMSEPRDVPPNSVYQSTPVFESVVAERTEDANDDDDMTVSTESDSISQDASAASLKRKLRKYKMKNRELKKESTTKSRALYEMEQKFDFLKLEFAQEKALQDETHAEVQEHVMEQDLQLLNLAHRNDVLEAELAKMKAQRNEAHAKIESLEKAVIHRDLRRIEATNERDVAVSDLKRTTRQRNKAMAKVESLSSERQELKMHVQQLTEQRDDARFKLKQAGIEIESPEMRDDVNGITSNASRWMKRKIMTKFPKRQDEVKVVPIEE